MYIVKSILPDVKSKLVFHLPKITVGCYFQVEKYRADGTTTYCGPWFANTVLNVGLDSLAGRRNLVPGGGDLSAVNRINVGTGTSEPATTNTGLDNFLASTGSLYGSLSVDHSVGDIAASLPAWKSFQQTFAFAIGFTGGNVNLTELGLSNASNSSYFNRQLFRDENNDPTVIQVQDDEGLRVTVRVVIYAPMAVDETDTGLADINGASKGYAIKQLGGDWLTGTGTAARIIAPGYIGTLSPDVYIATADGGFVAASSRSVVGYTAGSFYREVEAVWSPGTFIGAWKRIRTQMKNTTSPTNNVGGLFVATLDEAIEILDTEEIKITFRRSWGRV